ncbi:hypothetical protein [Flavobacterium adhaerens]|uniref:hypothetical protein n=1 Tax=Flavobacterium adhaerens TaxID=3149043 RepID=UPI0032B58C73
MSHFEKVKKLPIYQKAELLHQLVESLAASLPDEDEYIQVAKDLMRSDAMMIPAKIAGAEGGDLYSIRMQKAALIREHAIQLDIQISDLRFQKNYTNIEYVLLIRKELNEFRLLFIDWINSFDATNYVWDDWELFNPNGAIRPTDNNTHFEDDEFNSDDFWDNND